MNLIIPFYLFALPKFKLSKEHKSFSFSFRKVTLLIFFFSSILCYSNLDFVISFQFSFFNVNFHFWFLPATEWSRTSFWFVIVLNYWDWFLENWEVLNVREDQKNLIGLKCCHVTAFEPIKLSIQEKRWDTVKIWTVSHRLDFDWSKTMSCDYLSTNHKLRSQVGQPRLSKFADSIRQEQLT